MLQDMLTTNIKVSNPKIRPYGKALLETIAGYIYIKGPMGSGVTFNCEFPMIKGKHYIICLHSPTTFDIQISGNVDNTCVIHAINGTVKYTPEYSGNYKIMFLKETEDLTFSEIEIMECDKEETIYQKDLTDLSTILTEKNNKKSDHKWSQFNRPKKQKMWIRPITDSYVEKLKKMLMVKI